MVPMYFRGNMNFMSSITKIMYPGLKYEILTFEMSLFTQTKNKKRNEKNKTIKCFCHKNVSKLASYLVCTHDIIIHGKRKFIKNMTAATTRGQNMLPYIIDTCEN